MLLAAGTLFATVALAPKLKTLADLDAEYATNQLRLVELERQSIELEKVAQALEHDPAFAAELAKLEFSSGGIAGERIAVPEDLRLGATDIPETATPPAPPRSPLPQEILAPLAASRGLRLTLLATSATLALFAFVLLNERHAATARAITAEAAAALCRLTSRYQQAPRSRRT
jgi:hypothetical protein